MKSEDIHIPAPCEMKWEEMDGDERRRFCEGCGENVTNLSAMPESEAARFVKESAKACVRFDHAAGFVRFRERPCPPEVAKRPRWLRRVTGLSALLGVASSAFAGARLQEPRPVPWLVSKALALWASDTPVTPRVDGSFPQVVVENVMGQMPFPPTAIPSLHPPRQPLSPPVIQVEGPHIDLIAQVVNSWNLRMERLVDLNPGRGRIEIDWRIEDGKVVEAEIAGQELSDVDGAVLGQAMVAELRRWTFEGVDSARVKAGWTFRIPVPEKPAKTAVDAAFDDESWERALLGAMRPLPRDGLP